MSKEQASEYAEREFANLPNSSTTAMMIGVSKLIQKVIEIASEPEWISVEERLPEDLVKCLIIVGGEVNIGVYYKNYWPHNTPVTHWMPLPTKPKE